MNPHIKTSAPPSCTSSYLHKNSSDSHFQGFHLLSPHVPAPNMEPPSQLTWINPGSSSGNYDIGRTGRIIEGQGLSLSLSSSFRDFEAEKWDKLSLGHGELYFQSQGVGPSHNPYLGPQLFDTSRLSDHENQPHYGLVESASRTNVLRTSRYLRAAQDLLEEFCCVGRGQLKNQIFKNQDRNPNSNLDGDGDAAGSSSSKDHHHPISHAERSEYQRRKIKLLSMLDEVC